MNSNMLWLNRPADLLYNLLALVQVYLSILPFEAIFTGVIMLGFIPTYYRRLERVYRVYRRNPPVHGKEAPDIAPVLAFMRQYMEDCRFTMYSSMAIIW